jgi:hypothetical protein
MCGNNLRKLSHYGPWIPERLHQKCWKAQQNAAANQEYLLSKQQRDELFRRIVREGRADDVDPALRPLFDEVAEQMEREDIADTTFNPSTSLHPMLRSFRDSFNNRNLDDNEIGADEMFARLSVQNN